MTGPRIVSLLPAATEIVAALGFADRLVGRSHECDYPPGVAMLPALTRPRLDAGRTSRRIDKDVRAILRAALSVYELDVERLKALRPDVVVTQTRCAVCAVPLAEVEAALAGWTGGSPVLVALEPLKLADVWGDFARVGAALGQGWQGEEVAARLAERMDVISERVKASRSRPRVATIEWLDPPMAGGNWMPELVRLAGGRNLFGKVGGHSPHITLKELAAADPDVIVAAPCGLTLARTQAEAAALFARSSVARLAAVRGGGTYLADGHAYFNRPGPRLVESLEILAEILHPEAVSFGHEGRGWAHLANG